MDFETPETTFQKGQRVMCTSEGRYQTYQQLGTILECEGRRYKVLFDNMRVEGPIDEGQNLTSASWYFDIELTDATDEEPSDQN